MKKHTLCTFALLASFACSSPGESDVGSRFLKDSDVMLDFSKHRLASVTLEEVVKACQEATQYNFTYAASTEAALEEERVDLHRSKQIPAAEFTELMMQNGFSMRHIGPEHLHVVSIEYLAHH
jgi:hypothetical protein